MTYVPTELTEDLLNQQKCPLPNYTLGVIEQAIDGSISGVVTFIKLNDGRYHILSRYEDDEWIFPASNGTKATRKSNLTLKFGSIKDVQMRYMAKWFIWNRMQEGLAVGTLLNLNSQLKLFFAWISDTDIVSSRCLNAFTASCYVKYVNNKKVKRCGEYKALSPGIKTKKFFVLEGLYRYCKEFDFVVEHPWVESSAAEQAGWIGQAKEDFIIKGKTPIIPNEVLIPICQLTKGYLDKADYLLALKDRMDSYIQSGINVSGQSAQKRKYLQSITTEFETLHDFNEALILLRDSCIFWLLLTTGMRIHEVLGIKRGGYQTEIIDDITYYYIESISKKTHTGLADWIAPQIAKRSVEILGRYSKSLQHKLENDLLKARLNNDHAEVHRLETISGLVCLAKYTTKGNSINVLSGESITADRLPNLCKLIGSSWNLTSHQFRRTFANYVVHSELGDLRALKEHFKHWSINMTAMYAHNDELDSELFEELLRERYLVEEEIKQDWFNLDTPITGGELADNIKKIRSDKELIRTFGSHKEMAKAYSSSLPISSTGIGWCTSDEECKCGNPDLCESGIIDKSYLPYWEGMLVQQMKLSLLDDIGDAGQAAVAKGMNRCEKVLSSLGIDVEALKTKIISRGQIEILNVK